MARRSVAKEFPSRRTSLRPLHAGLLMLLLTVVSATNPVAIRLGIRYLPPYYLGTVRMMLISAGLVGFAWLTHRSLLPPSSARRDLGIAVILKAISLLGLYAALARTEVIHAAVIGRLAPVLTLLFAHQLLPDDRMTWRNTLGVGCGCAGVLSLVMRDYRHAPTLFVGDILMLGTTVCLVAMTIYEKRALKQGATPLQLSVCTAVISAMVLGMASFLSERSETIRWTVEGFGCVLYLATVCGIFLFVFRRWLLQQLKVTYMSAFGYLGWFLKMGFGMAILGESMTQSIGLAIGLVFAGLLCLHLESRDAVEPLSPSMNLPRQPVSREGTG